MKEQVRIFCDSGAQDLERKINDWLEDFSNINITEYSIRW